MRFILTILLFLSQLSYGQIINASQPYRPMVVAAPVAGFLLDDYPTGGAAYSLRQVKTGATRSVRLRRSNDNTESDFGFDGTGELDTAAIKTWVGASNAFVTSFYNQNGDSLHFTQSTAASQPRLVNAGVIERRNGKPSLFFDGSNDFMTVASSTASFNYLHQSGQAFVSVVAQSNSSSAAGVYLSNSNGSTQVGILLYSYATARFESVISRAASGQNTSVNASANNAFTAGSLFLLINELDNNNATASQRNKIYHNGGSVIANNASTNAPSTANATNIMQLGRRNNNDLYLGGYISEVITWNSNQSSNRTGIESNINGYYGIY
jgi:hypothetical protein